MERGDGDTSCNWNTRNNPQKTSKMTGKLGNKIKSNPEHNIIKVSQNIEESPGDLKRLVCYSNSSERPLADTGVKTLKEWR